MRINTAIILCAGLGKRLNPLTLNTPKPLLKLKNVTMLESCIDTIIKLKIKKIFINTFHLGDQITDFIKNKNFSIDTSTKDIFNFCIDDYRKNKSEIAIFTIGLFNSSSPFFYSEWSFNRHWFR